MFLSNANTSRLIVLGAIVVIVVVAVVLVPRFQSENFALPKRLGALPLTEEIRGNRARKIINQMHGKSVTPTDNIIGVYANDRGTASVYLSLYDSQSHAQETFQQMVHGIEKGPFSDYNRQTLHGQDVAYCVGFGQAHYFFFIDKSVYWLTTDFSVAKEAATELIRAIRDSSTTV